MQSKTIAARIKRLEIQGARNIAREGLAALAVDAKASKAKTLADFKKEIYSNSKLLAGARPTEPALRNGLAFAKRAMEAQRDLPAAKSAVCEAVSQYNESMAEAKQRIADLGAKLIKSGMTVFTHCHSSTVTNILITAKKQGKKFRVINTETRPLYQGRTTATELARARIPVLHIVDSAARRFMAQTDLVIVGADAVTARGELVNKVGTSAIALAARDAGVEFASACETFKFDPLTIGGKPEPIEERAASEIWEKPPKGVRIANPAFDVTEPELIGYFITEVGLIKPKEAERIIRTRCQR